MLRSLGSLVGDRIIAEDGFAGQVVDFVINTSDWRIAELIADIGKWWRSRNVLIPFTVLRRPVGSSGMLPVALTRSETKKCAPATGELPSDRHPQETVPVERSSAQESATPRLMRWQALLDSQAQALDGPAGSVRDLIVDDETWHVCYLVVELAMDSTSRQALVPDSRVSLTSGEQTSMTLDICIRDIAGSPKYDPRAPISREVEAQLHDYYEHSPRTRSTDVAGRRGN